MNRLNLSLLLSVWIVFPAWSQAPTIPDDWVAVKAARNAFEFKAPPDLEKVPVRGVDSLVGKYESPSMLLTYDYGWYSSPLPDEKQPGYSSKIVKINGKTAKVVTFDGVAAVHFPKVKDKIRLTVYVILKRRKQRRPRCSCFGRFVSNNLDPDTRPLPSERRRSSAAWS